MAIAGGGQWLLQRVIGVESAASAWGTESTTVTAGRSGVVTGAFGKPNGVSSQRQSRGWSRSSPPLESIGSTGTLQPQSHAPAGQQQQRIGAASSDGDGVGATQVSGPTSCARMRITAFITSIPEQRRPPDNSGRPRHSPDLANGSAGDEADRTGTGAGSQLNSIIHRRPRPHRYPVGAGAPFPERESEVWPPLIAKERSISRNRHTASFRSVKAGGFGPATPKRNRISCSETLLVRLMSATVLERRSHSLAL